MITLEHLMRNQQELPVAVLGFLIHNEKVLLGQNLLVQHDDKESMWLGIQGKVGNSPKTFSETELDAIIRLLYQNTTIVPLSEGVTKQGRVRLYSPYDSGNSLELSIFVITKWVGEPKNTSSLAPKWFPIMELPLQNMPADYAYWMPWLVLGRSVDAAFVMGSNNDVLEHSVKLSD